VDEKQVQGHIFRSELLDKFAIIEGLAVSCLTNGKQPPSAATLGQKLDALLKLCAQNPPVLKSAKKIAERLTRLKPYQELRATIVHSQIEVWANSKSETIYCFRNAAFIKLPERLRPVILTSKDCDHILHEVQKVCNELKQLTTNPPSPPPPSRAAAGGP
jgi:hypothetical protein